MKTLVFESCKWIAIVGATLVVAFWLAHTAGSHKGYPYAINPLVGFKHKVIPTKRNYTVALYSECASKTSAGITQLDWDVARHLRRIRGDVESLRYVTVVVTEANASDVVIF